MSKVQIKVLTVLNGNVIAESESDVLDVDYREIISSLRKNADADPRKSALVQTPDGVIKVSKYGLVEIYSARLVLSDEVRDEIRAEKAELRGRDED